MFKLVKQSPVVQLSSVLGNRPVFTLTDPLRVRKGMIVALTTPTWLSNLADYGANNSDAWRASREEGQCLSEQDLLERSRPQQKVGGKRRTTPAPTRALAFSTGRTWPPSSADPPTRRRLGLCSQYCSKVSVGLCPRASAGGAGALVPPRRFPPPTRPPRCPGPGRRPRDPRRGRGAVRRRPSPSPREARAPRSSSCSSRRWSSGLVVTVVVSAGAVVVSSSSPHAARPMQAAIASAAAAARAVPRSRVITAFAERGLAQAAVGTVADVEADQLIAAPALAQVRGRAQQGRVRRRQRQDAGDRLHLLAGLAIDVDAVRLGDRERLTARGAAAKPVFCRGFCTAAESISSSRGSAGAGL